VPSYEFQIFSLRQPLKAAKKSSSGSEDHSTVVVNNHVNVLGDQEPALPRNTDRGRCDRKTNVQTNIVYDEEDNEIFVLGENLY